MITIIDYGMGNLGSIKNMLKRIGAEAVISKDLNVIAKAEKLILPGVGAFDHGMKNIINNGLLEILNECVLQKKTPILGICLGMQLLTKSSEEGELPGLGWIDAVTRRFKFDDSAMKIPHMGWNSINIVNNESLFKDIYPESRFYFVHSYCISCSNPSDILATTVYGYEFVSSFQSGNIMGVQFHPEKSHKFGMKLLKNFVELF